MIEKDFKERQSGTSSTNSTTLNPNRIVFLGRSLAEYMRMFNLNPPDLKGKRILDCTSGASSFVAELFRDYNAKSVTGCDILYDNDAHTLEKKGKEDIEYMLERLKPVSHIYNWDFYRDLEDLRNYRTNSLLKFIYDYLEEKRRRDILDQNYQNCLLRIKLLT